MVSFQQISKPSPGAGGGTTQSRGWGGSMGLRAELGGRGAERGAGGQHESGAEDQREILVAPTPACLSRGAGGHSLRKAQDWGSSPARVPSCVRGTVPLTPQDAHAHRAQAWAPLAATWAPVHARALAHVLARTHTRTFTRSPGPGSFLRARAQLESWLPRCNFKRGCL